LKELEGQQGLTPFQQFSRLSSIPGITPQMIQSGAELLRQQGMRSSFANGRGENSREIPASAQPNQEMRNQDIRNVEFGQKSPMKRDNGISKTKGIPSDFQNREEEALSNQGSVRENPTKEKFIPGINWSPAERDAEIAREWERNPNLTFEQATARAQDNEQRYLAAPEAYQAQQKYLKAQEDEADAEFDKQLETALQKEGKDVYGDLTGDTLLDVKKAMRHDLATNPKLTPKTAAEIWRKKAKDFVEKKNQFKTLARRDLTDKILPWKKEQTVKALQQTQKSYAELGRKREFYNMLRTSNSPSVYNDEGKIIKNATHGFGLSPGGAALLGYPPSEPLKKVIKDSRSLLESRPLAKSQGFDNSAKTARKIADDFAKNRTNEDSILAFARDMKDTSPMFNEEAFIDYLRENQEEYSFNSDQKKELELPKSDFFPNWGDLALFPILNQRSLP